MPGAGSNRSKKTGLADNFRYWMVATTLLAIAGTVVAEPVTIELISASSGYDQRTNEPIVTFKMSPASARLFAEMTQKNVGRKFEIRIDEKAVTAPVIREPIFGGSGQISGSFTEQQARDIAARLSSGASKLEMEIID